MSTLEWQVIPLEYYGNELWAEWQRLFHLYHSHNPMLDPRFVSTLVEYYPENIHVALGKEGDEISAIVLLEKISLGQWKNYMPSQSQVALILVKPSIDINFHGLSTALGFGEIKLDFFSLDPQEHNVLINHVKHLQNYALNIKVYITGDFLSYWQSRAKRLQKDIKRSLKRLEKDKKIVTHQWIKSAEGIEAAVDRYGMLEMKGWKGKRGTALHPGNTQGQFYCSLLHNYAENHQALVFESYIDEQLVAARLCIFSEATLIILKTTYDESYRRYALGNLNRYKLIEYLFETRLCKSVDFYTNASKEQLYWSTEQRSMYNATCYRNTMVEGIVTAMKKIKNTLT